MVPESIKNTNIRKEKDKINNPYLLFNCAYCFAEFMSLNKSPSLCNKRKIKLEEQHAARMDIKHHDRQIPYYERQC